MRWFLTGGLLGVLLESSSRGWEGNRNRQKLSCSAFTTKASADPTVTLELMVLCSCSPCAHMRGAGLWEKQLPVANDNFWSGIPGTHRLQQPALTAALASERALVVHPKSTTLSLWASLSSFPSTKNNALYTEARVPLEQRRERSNITCGPTNENVFGKWGWKEKGEKCSIAMTKAVKKEWRKDWLGLHVWDFVSKLSWFFHVAGLVLWCITCICIIEITTHPKESGDGHLEHSIRYAIVWLIHVLHPVADILVCKTKAEDVRYPLLFSQFSVPKKTDSRRRWCRRSGFAEQMGKAGFIKHPGIKEDTLWTGKSALLVPVSIWQRELWLCLGSRKWTGHILKPKMLMKIC